MMLRVGLLLLLSALPVWAATFQGITLGWEYERFTWLDSFVMTATPEGSRPRQYRVPVSAPGQCDAALGDEAFCATIPECPPLGRTTYAVTALAQDGSETAPSNTVTCTMTGPCVGTCEPFVASSSAPPLATLGPSGGMLPPPGVGAPGGPLPGEPGAPASPDGASGTPSAPPGSGPGVPLPGGSPPRTPVTAPGGIVGPWERPAVFWRPPPLAQMAPRPGT